MPLTSHPITAKEALFAMNLTIPFVDPLRMETFISPKVHTLIGFYTVDNVTTVDVYKVTAYTESGARLKFRESVTSFLANVRDVDSVTVPVELEPSSLSDRTAVKFSQPVP